MIRRTDLYIGALESKIDSLEREVTEIHALAEVDLQNADKSYAFLTEEYEKLKKDYIDLRAKHEVLVKEVADGEKKTKAKEKAA
tara:strand:- start:420 stop:671 length:252 start_codon:yes stop_codon:yes gene_type:complete